MNRILSRTCPGWAYLSNHQSDPAGRIILLWKVPISLTCLQQTKQFVTCRIIIPGGHMFYYTAVYASNLREERADLWCSLLDLQRQFSLNHHPWVVCGDFNQIKHHSEHSSATVGHLSANMVEFADCLMQLELDDLRYQGLTYTWSNKNPVTPIAKKLDRLMVNNSWLTTYPHSSCAFLPPLISDHSPCLLNLATPLPVFGTKPFKYYNFLAKHPSFLSIVESSWNPTGTPSTQMPDLSSISVKLKLLKRDLQQLLKDNFSQIERRVKETNILFQSVQEQAMQNPTPQLFQQERDLHAKWEFLHNIEEAYYKQKSRVNWLKEGDSNTSYFHRVSVARNSRNSIRAITSSSGTLITDPKLLSKKVVLHFQRILSPTRRPSSFCSLAWMRSTSSTRCHEAMKQSMVATPSVENIAKTIMRMNANKSPGPDGYTAGFFKAAWPIVGSEIVHAISNFFTTGFLPAAVNSTILCLVPKKTGASALTDFRPISCCNTLYKLISKILVQKLKPLLPNWILHNQSAFVQGKLLVENVLLAAEIVNGSQRKNSAKQMVLKVDISKAFDTLRWDFVLTCLRGADVPELYIRWVEACITTPSFSVGFNGHLHGFFKGKRGLRQGDPLSPYLFVIAMNVLSLMLDRATQEGKFSYHPKCRDARVTHLAFTDDLIIFMDGTLNSIQGVLQVLREFERISGLAISIPKSSFYPSSLTELESDSISAETGINVGYLPIRYLGLPLSPKKLNTLGCAPLLQQIKTKLNSWTARALSFAGRLLLLNSVINGKTTFWCSAYILPKKVIATINSLSSAFLWHGTTESGHSARVSWEKVTTLKREGGLGLRNLEAWNKASVLKLIWMIFFKQGSIWVAWFIRESLGGRVNNFWIQKEQQKNSWLNNKLLRVREDAYNWIKLKLGDGHTCYYWSDNWSPFGRLSEFLYPLTPLQIGIHARTTLSMLCHNGIWVLGTARTEPQVQVLAYLTTMSLNDHPDGYSWWIDDTHKAKNSTSVIYKAIRPHQQQVEWHKLIWFQGGIPKHMFLAWLFTLNRCPTKDRLISWGLNSDPLCLLCGTGEESRDHLLFECSYSWSLWDKVARRCSFSPSRTWQQTISNLLHSPMGKLRNQLTLLAWQASIYVIWFERNSKLHNNTFAPTDSLFSKIDRLIHNRASSFRDERPDLASALNQLWFSTL